MKSNNCSQKIFKGAKYFLLVPVVIVFVSLIMFIIFSFNKGYDFKNNYTFTLNYKSDISSSKYNDCDNIIKNNIYDKFGNKVTVVTQKLNEDIETATLVKVYTNDKSDKMTDDLNAVVEQIKSQVNVKIGDGHSIVSDVMFAKGQNYSAEVLWTGISLLVIMAVIFAYLWIRYELKTAITSLVIAPFITIMYTALYVLLRLPVSSLYCTPLIISTIISYVIFIVYANITRGYLKNDKYNKCTNAEILTLAMDKIKTIVLSIICLTTFAYIVTMFFFTWRFVVFAISGLIGLILAVYASIVLSSLLWSKMYRRDKDMRLREEKENEEKKLKEGNKKKTKEEEEKILV